MASWGYIGGKIEFHINNFDFWDIRTLINIAIDRFNFDKEYTLKISDNYNQVHSDYEGDVYLIMRSFSSPASHDVIEIHPRISLRHIDDKNKQILFDIENFLKNIFEKINEIIQEDYKDDVPEDEKMKINYTIEEEKLKVLINGKHITSG